MQQIWLLHSSVGRQKVDLRDPFSIAILFSSLILSYLPHLNNLFQKKLQHYNWDWKEKPRNMVKIWERLEPKTGGCRESERLQPLYFSLFHLSSFTHTLIFPPTFLLLFQQQSPSFSFSPFSLPPTLFFFLQTTLSFAFSSNIFFQLILIHHTISHFLILLSLSSLSLLTSYAISSLSFSTTSWNQFYFILHPNLSPLL